jgi:predicted type IV restriction endonuclease
MEDDLVDFRNRIRAGRFPNEATVSQGIVRRLLDLLSWPVYDTDIVMPEYSVSGRRVDYALCHPPQKPIVFIEVK